MATPVYTASVGPSGYQRVCKDGEPLSPDQVQAEILTLLGRLVELAEPAVAPMPTFPPGKVGLLHRHAGDAHSPDAVAHIDEPVVSVTRPPPQKGKGGR